MLGHMTRRLDVQVNDLALPVVLLPVALVGRRGG